MTPLAEVERSAEVARAAPVIPRAMRRLSNIRVRNVATVGGNLAHGDPHMDLPPVLIALGAEVAVVGPTGERTIAVENLFAGYFETVLAKNELIAELRIPAQGKSRAAYIKVTTGSAEDWPALGVAVALDGRRPGSQVRARRRQRRDREGHASHSARKRRSPAQPSTTAILARAGDAAAEEAECISDVRGSAAYKRELLRVYVGARRAASPRRTALSTKASNGASALMATTTTQGRRQPRASARQVGRSLPRLEAREKVTGRAEYTHTMRLPGMLHGKIFRSTVAHGRIKSIDASAARQVPGVYRVVTSEDVRKVIPEPYYGPAFHDQPILAIDKVHYVGEPVAVVLAADPACRRGGGATDRRRIRGAAGDLRRGRGRREQDPGARGAQARRHLRRSQASQGPQGHQYRARFQAQARRRRQGLRRGRARVRAHLPHAEGPPSRARAVSRRSATGRKPGLTIYSASQGPSFVRTEIARLLGWPENRVRIKVPYLGGGFGGKLYIKLEALVTALSMIVRRPVKVALTMEEQFYTITKHP